jgi:hypothetical protein
MNSPLNVEIELNIDERVGAMMRAYPILYPSRKSAILGIFLTSGAGYYWCKGQIGNEFLTQRFIDALKDFREFGHIEDKPSPISFPPIVYSPNIILSTIPDDVEPDALMAAWEVLDYLDNDPGIELPKKENRSYIFRKRGQEMARQIKKNLISRGLISQPPE